jgi:hypothetical protein
MLMPHGMDCPWCEAPMGLDLADPALRAVTCPECATTVELDADEPIAFPIAA